MCRIHPYPITNMAMIKRIAPIRINSVGLRFGNSLSLSRKMGDVFGEISMSKPRHNPITINAIFKRKLGHRPLT
jgi:hypothetical protein